MKKIILTSIVVMITFLGCASKVPFNKHNKFIAFNNGNAYFIPYGVYHGSTISTKRFLDILRQAGMYGCQINDIIWTESKHTNQVKDDPKSLYNTSYDKWLAESQKMGLAGCVSPMSDREFFYRTGQQRQNKRFQHEQNIESKKRLNDTMNTIMPKTNNVNIRNY